MRTKNLKEDKLHLRPYAMSDADTIYENLGCDPEMMRYTGWNPYFSPEATENFVADVIRKYESDEKEYSWLITYKGEPVGTIGAYDYDVEQNCIEIGYSIFRRYWGNGFASRALKLVKDYLMQEEGIHTLKAWSADANIASKRVLEKAGFVQTEVKEAAINVNGEQFVESLSGRTFASMSRRAKYLSFHMDNGDELVLHLRMTGQLLLSGVPEEKRMINGVIPLLN